MVAINLVVSLNSCWGGILIHDYILNEIINNERKVNKCAKDLEIIKSNSVLEGVLEHSVVLVPRRHVFVVFILRLLFH
jgi:hypothetical protein